ncbi:MAG: hypothetical protein GQ570_05050 [Helicobacteraceae bacterium]|nr:hypothetical protein [Helicobacteraceae bacterium]
MYIRRKIRFKILFLDSWIFLLLTASWAAFAVYLHDFVGLGLISIPIAPITTIGIAVSIYLGFKSKETYDRWWEARKIWGDIINKSRSWSNKVHTLPFLDNGTPISDTVKKELIYNHLAWITALKYQLRETSRLPKGNSLRMFNHKFIPDDEFDELSNFLDTKKLDQLSNYSNVATQILIKQGQLVQKMTIDGYLDSRKQVSFTESIEHLYDAQGKCERIKKTPFPRAFAHIGQIFTWIFMLLLPLGFIEIFEDQGLKYLHDALLQREYMFALVPFTMIISWVFFIMERVSDSMEDPFEGGVNDLPLNAMVRTVEIDLKESLGEKDIPLPVQPINDILN